MTPPNQQLLRKLPSVDDLLSAEELQKVGKAVPQRIVADEVRAAIDQVRRLLMTQPPADVNEETLRRSIIDRAAERIASAGRPHYRRVVNATGIILHTALGRAVLGQRALQQIQQHIGGYSLLQMDLETSQRCQRDDRIAALLRQLTGAEAATVVNNNAAATAIVLNTVAAGREVVVSRGQLIEIGGSFRLPEVMAASGVKLVEVGTTNKTHPYDYENAINENTAAIMRVHPSNYKITGFSSEVPLDVLVKIAHEHGLTLIDDVGAGALIDFSRFGFEYEPTLVDSIRTGADVVTSSADKLIGACQGGIILGKKKLIDAIRTNPWARILRVDKLTLAALEATIILFFDESLALTEVPTLAMLKRAPSEIAQHARHIASTLEQKNCAAAIAVLDGFSQMGSGSLPTQNLPTHLVAVSPRQMQVDELVRRLRLYEPPIIARIQNDRLLIDPRTLLEGEQVIVIQAIVDVLAGE